MSATDWTVLFENFARETGALRGVIKSRDFASGRAILDSPPDARAWFLLEAWRLNGADWPGGPHARFNTASLLALARELPRREMFCTPDQMQRIVWLAGLDELTNSLLRNVERHLEHWGMTPDLCKMLEIKRIEVARGARNKKDRELLQRIDFLLGRREQTE
ncbi:MAG TPA: hypothetical protein VGB45_07935 [Abditibacterium sp.]|jgi:hypothetical protein